MKKKKKVLRSKKASNTEFWNEIQLQAEIIGTTLLQEKMCIVLESRCIPQHSLRAQKAVKKPPNIAYNCHNVITLNLIYTTY